MEDDQAEESEKNTENENENEKNSIGKARKCGKTDDEMNVTRIHFVHLEWLRFEMEYYFSYFFFLS